MLKIKNIGLFVLGLFFFSSCEDVIELELESVESQIVIEATLDAGNQIATVNISKTNDFYDNDSPEQVSDAVIILQSDLGNTYTLSETSPGTYTAINVLANQGEIFNLIVEVDGKFYEATSQTPVAVSLDSIIQANFPGGPFSDEGDILLSAVWNDPDNVQNFYRIRAYIDNVFQSDNYTIINDVLAGDGEEITASIAQGFNENTTVEVELLSTDEAYYDYFFQLSSLSGGGAGSTTPYNPKGNFSNDALGYFGIYYSSSIEIQL
jgi:hypothetical protein